MADTRQVVSWALERKCSMRSGEEWFLPDQSSKQLGNLRTVAAAESDRRIVDGICVTCWTMERDQQGSMHDIPSSGFVIKERLALVGGLDTALATCKTCEANAHAELGLPVAGCFGDLDIRPDSEELDQQLWSIIKERNWEEKLCAAFPVTTPLCYGFWITSPLRRRQCEFLHELFSAACEWDNPEEKEVRHFISALDAAIRWELPLHVSLVPLGHTDLGWFTIFPHCPRCKANAPVGRWKENFTKATQECRACRHSFIPDDHHRSERFEPDFDADNLKRTLGDVEYDALVRAFLTHRGCSSSQVDEIIDNQNNGPLLRRVLEVRRKREATLKQLRHQPATHSGDQLPATMSLALADDVNLEFVLIPAGEFDMGSLNEVDHTIEAPRHVVRIPRPYYLGRYTVTQVQWTAVMGNNTSKHQGDPRLPVDQVSWLDAQEFCERLCQRYGRVFRLPSEAEWEYACRAGTTTDYAFGITLSPHQANFTSSKSFMGEMADEAALIREIERDIEQQEYAGRQGAKPVIVGSYPPNAWGLHDMHGNVDEWCEDVWHSSYDGAPADGSAWLEGEDREPFRVMRGGWASATEFVCTSSSRRQMRADAGEREDSPKNDDEEDDGFLNTLFDVMYTPFGFRVVCECR